MDLPTGASPDELPKLGVKEYAGKKLSATANGVHTGPRPLQPYPEVAGIPDAYHIFHLGGGGLPEPQRERALATAKAHHSSQRSTFLGYQGSFAPARYQHQFSHYLDTLLNNVGDAFLESSSGMNSKFMERAVLDYYAALWHAKLPQSDMDLESYWGYVLSMGATEGNLFGMWNARNYLAGKKIFINGLAAASGGDRPQPHAKPTSNGPRAYSPITFYSEETHSCFPKAMNMLGMKTFSSEGTETFPAQCPITVDGHWPARVPLHRDSGAMNLDALAALVQFFASRGYPIIVAFNYGSASRCALDDVALACQKLRPILEEHGLLEREIQFADDDGTLKRDVRNGYWFHVDAALGAAYMPFVEMACQGGLIDKKFPVFDFRLPMVSSIAMSGHKWIGASIPCGIYMTRTKLRMGALNATCIHIADTTLSGSRSGLPPMLLWNYIAQHSFEDQIRTVIRLEELAAYAERRLRHLQDEVVKRELFVERGPLALSVCFKRPSQELCYKYSLGNHDGDGRLYSHVYVMEHVTCELLDAFIDDLARDAGAFTNP